MENIIQFPKLGLEFAVKDYLFSIGSLKFYIYGIIIAIGLVLGLIYAFKNFRKVGVDPDKAIDCILGGIIGGIVGARLYYVIFSWENFGLDFSSWDGFLHTFLRLFNTREGGMAIYGGLIGALLVGVLIARWRKMNVKPLLDVIGIGFLLGQGIGRWGNFVNVEAFGSNTTMPWGMTSPVITNYLNAKLDYFNTIGVSVDPNMPVHPCFLYESLWCLLGFVLLAFYLKHRKFDGEVFLMYLGYYGVGRFVIEGLRTDSLMIGALRVSQLLAALLAVASVIAIIIVRSRIKNNHDENYLKLFVLTPEGEKIRDNIKEVEIEDEAVVENDEAVAIADEFTEEIADEARVDSENKIDDSDKKDDDK